MLPSLCASLQHGGFYLPVTEIKTLGNQALWLKNVEILNLNQESMNLFGTELSHGQKTI
jgi:hypothetical protein